MARILVVGGAGFIGSHMMKTLVKAGHDAVAFDNLSTGHADAVIYGELVEGDLANPDHIKDVLTNGRFDGVMHFASNIEVGESVTDPRKYYTNNVTNTLNLIHAMMDQGLNNLIFSSTAAVYGIPEYTPVDEDHPCRPINPYGKTKHMIESILSDYRDAYGFASTALRYFNAAGADPDGELGERHEPESHLIPLVIQAALGQRSDIRIYGTDYDTRDGTCARDYIHVTDLCDAHLLAMDQLLKGSVGSVYNLGNGEGFSVREVIETVREVSGRDFVSTETNRRAGDPAVLVANASRAKVDLNWHPTFGSIEAIVGDAWDFYQTTIGRARSAS
ncbi:UDP-glucose 4-epimerase GalE [Shewanella sp.]|uniref:UDP-glucose 4-epimerase GalE n=1 Tax=Shewanella sp. TaxID=50422 RepID=UPI004047E247